MRVHWLVLAGQMKLPFGVEPQTSPPHVGVLAMQAPF